jgi:hypothetical protein
MQPKSFDVKDDERISVTFRTGDNFTGALWMFDKTALKSIAMHRQSHSEDLSDSLVVGEKDHLRYRVNGQGTLLIAMETIASSRTMSGEEFNMYLKDNVLDDILSLRKKTNKLLMPAEELYSDHAKLLMQVGDRLDDAYKKVIGHQVEIVPEKNPYELRTGDDVRFRILINKKPAFGTRVKVWNRFDNRTTIQNIYTEQDGTMLVRISSPGPWMISVVSMEQSTESDDQWRSYRASLVFGIKQ